MELHGESPLAASLHYLVNSGETRMIGVYSPFSARTRITKAGPSNVAGDFDRLAYGGCGSYVGRSMLTTSGITCMTTSAPNPVRRSRRSVV